MNLIKYATHLDVRPLDDGKQWLVLKPFIVENHHKSVIYIPAGFITDFASIPKLARRWFQPATGKYRKAAVVHDLLYSTQRITRKEADVIFLALMNVSNVNRWKAKLIYWAVRLGGWQAWKQNKPKMARWIKCQNDQFAQQSQYKVMFA